MITYRNMDTKDAGYGVVVIFGGRVIGAIERNRDCDYLFKPHSLEFEGNFGLRHSVMEEITRKMNEMKEVYANRKMD